MITIPGQPSTVTWSFEWMKAVAWGTPVRQGHVVIVGLGKK